jgi:uncharacterized protein (DUF488 family)
MPVPSPDPQTSIYTIGHSTRSAEELLALLADAGVKLLVDVRALPSSRRHPQFDRVAMTEWLDPAGVGYLHMRALGGRRKPSAGSPNGGWREPGFRGYADHMGSGEWRDALEELESEARKRTTAIMCAEAMWWRCHRRLISDALVARGWRVEHLGVGGAHAVHELPDFAVMKANGTVTYPPRQGTLLDGPSTRSRPATGR